MLNKSWFVVLLLVAFATPFVVIGMMDADISLYAEHCAKGAHADQENCTTYHVALIPLIELGAFLENHHGALTAIATGFIAWFTLTLWRATNNLGNITHEVHEATIAGQRAYVTVRSPKSELIFDQNNNLHALRVWVVWQNSGMTPASPMFSAVTATWVPHGAQFRFEQAADTVRNPLVLGPKSEIESGWINIAPAHAQAVLNGAARQFFWGDATYRDIFPTSPEHVIEFCFEVAIEGQLIAVPGACTIRFNVHPEHNRYYDNPNS